MPLLVRIKEEKPFIKMLVSLMGFIISFGLSLLVTFNSICLVNKLMVSMIITIFFELGASYLVELMILYEIKNELQFVSNNESEKCFQT